MHLHIVDLDCVGPTFNHLRHKNLSIDDAIAVLEAEAGEGKPMLRKSASMLTGA